VKLLADAGRVATFAQFRPFVDRWMRYPVMAAPPVDAGVHHATVTRRSPGVARTLRGAPGTVRGTTRTEAALAGEFPAAFVATTRNVYPVPLVRPDTTHDRAPVVVHVRPPGDAVTR